MSANAKRAGSVASGDDPKAKRLKKEVKPGQGFDTRWKFKIEPQPPKFPFMGEYFDLNIYLVDTDGKLMVDYEVPITLELFVEGESIPVQNTISSSPCIEIDPSTPPLIERGKGCAALRVKVLELSRTRGNRKFCFMVKRRAGPRGNLPREVSPVMTRAMLVVNAHIVVTNEMPKVWYKDQGGRDKCIDIDLELVGPHGIVTGQEVPLKCVLLYEDFKQVLHQDILQPSPTTVLKIGTSGKTRVRLRIEDVSKNHQSKNFRIRIEPDTSNSPVHFDKSPDVTGPVLVRSKLNRRQKQKMMEQQKEMADMSAADVAAAKLVLPNGKDGVQDLSTFSPHLASAIWCEHARDALAGLQAVAARLVHQYDSTIRPQVREVLANRKADGIFSLDSIGGHGDDAHLRQDSNGANSDALTSDSNDPGPSRLQPTTSSGSMLPSTRSMNDQLGMQPFGGAAATAGSLNPGQSISGGAPGGGVPGQPGGPGMAQQSNNTLDRGISTFSMAGVEDFMRGTSALVRGLSLTIGGGGNGGGGNGGYGQAPSDLPREISTLSFPGESFGANSPRYPPVSTSQGHQLGVYGSNPSSIHSNNPRGPGGPGMSQQGMAGVPAEPISMRTRRQRSRGSTGVAWIWREVCAGKDGNVKGLPALDKNKRLVGFYFKLTDTDVGFRDVGNAGLSNRDISAIEAHFAGIDQSRTPAIAEVASTEDGYDIAKAFFQTSFPA
ncbi:Hypothetical Protein FCC1311_075942 [Hondaea fermentalgiana]|uniref:Uncharacterized protein n=1 Tax=Hondaea fermentalgiana TaxID=2315210 RepID=A0A2R5GKG8_9STRA|nr:Hypothetical Protein FCC1311_075942 [Hondaea fermentalgiana]|eukprot:GBG31370.1 Hypothetical Protein FCC1311_075942 [Hondaea fermentalgiana]